MNEEFIKKIKKLSPKEGDIIFIRVDENATMRQIAEMRRALTGIVKLHKGVDFIVTSVNMDMEVKKE